MITCAKSVKIGLSSFKSVLIGIRPLLEIPWNGEAANGTVQGKGHIVLNLEAVSYLYNTQLSDLCI